MPSNPATTESPAIGLAGWWARGWVRALMLLVPCLAAWSTAVHSGFVTLDTPWLVTENPILSTGDLRWVPTILWDMDRGTRLVLGAEYLPVRDLSVLMDFMLVGPRWSWHHAHSLAWYLGACLLFLRLCERLVPQRAVAWLVAALFALHPVHVEAVTWLASRKDVISLFFFLLAVLVWLEAHGRAWRSGAVVVCMALAVWAKNTAIVLPAVLALFSLVHLRQRPTTARWWLQWVPLGLVTALALGVSLALGERVAMYAEVRGGSTAAALLLESRVVFRYLGLLAWPRNLVVIYPEPPLLPLLHLSSLAALTGVAVLLAAVPVCARRWPLVSMGLGWFFLTLLPVSQLVPIQNLMADRYLLLPLGGIVLVLAQPMLWLRQRFGSMPLWVVSVACLVLGGLTFRQNRVWHDSVTLWTAALERSPQDARIRRNLAGVLAAEGQREQAVDILERGIRDHGEHPQLLAGLGLLMLQQGEDERAEELLGAAWEGDDGLRRAGGNLVSVLVRRGRLDQAVQRGEALTRAHPFYAKGWNNHGSALLGAGRLEDADEAFRLASDLDPFYATPRCNLALVALQRGLPTHVSLWAGRCQELDPDSRLAAELMTMVGGVDPPG